MDYSEYDINARRKREFLLLWAIVGILEGDFLMFYLKNRIWMFRCLMFSSLMTTLAMHGYIAYIYFNTAGKISGRKAIQIYLGSLVNNMVNAIIMVAGLYGCFGNIKDACCGVIALVAVMLCAIDFIRINSKVDLKETFLNWVVSYVE